MGNKTGKIYKGVGVTNGKTSGKIKILKKKSPISYTNENTDVGEELTRLRTAVKDSVQQLKLLEEKTRRLVGNDEAQIFEIHQMILADDDLIDGFETEISKGKRAESAVADVSRKYRETLSLMDDEYLSARQKDIEDVSTRIIDNLLGEADEFEDNDNEPYILIAEDLTPSQTVQLELSRILGFVTFGGTPSSHTAILARSMGIPAIVGVGKIENCVDGELALMNAETGMLIISPTNKEKADFEKERNSYNKIAKEHDIYLRSVMNKPAVTRSGHRILIYANIGSEAEVASAISNGAEGIGLLRSEFLYLSRKNYPDEEELFSAYRDIAIKMQGKRVIIRTLDIGADKQIPYFNIPREENPALGYRAIRICLDRQELFKTQLRAILRASAFGQVALMLPMVVSLSEVKEAKLILEECKGELLTRGQPFDSKIEIGIMIETPASAIMSKELAREVEFFSVGTNDLTQYTLAADRQNPRLTHLCESNTEPVLRLISAAADAIHAKGGWIGVCGEMAADLDMTERLVSMGVDELSVAVPYLLGVRRKVCEC